MASNRQLAALESYEEKSITSPPFFCHFILVQLNLIGWWWQSRTGPDTVCQQICASVVEFSTFRPTLVGNLGLRQARHHCTAGIYILLLSPHQVVGIVSDFYLKWQSFGQAIITKKYQKRYKNLVSA